MNRYLRAVCGALAASSFLSLALTGQVARRLTQLPPDDAARVALPASLSGRTATAEHLGSLPGSTVLTGLSLVLKPTEAQSAALAQLLRDQQDPSGPSYHQWLTPQQFGERFGVADEDLALLRTWLERAGLRVDEVAASRNSIRFSGAAADVAAAFGTALNQYRDGGQSFHENSAPVQLPGGIAAVVQGVSGLSSYRLTPQHVRMSATQAAAGAASPGSYGMASPQYTTAGSNGTVHDLVPWDFRQIYGINTLINSGFDGTGIKIGVIGQSAVDTQQLTYFQGKTGQPAKLPAMVLLPNSGASNRVGGDEAESELDLEYASGSAPGAAVQFIYTGCTAMASPNPLSSATDCGNNGVFAALVYAVTNNLAPILTVSYGGCEIDLAALASTTLEPILQQANAQGQTVVVASGDGGAAACDQTGSTVTVATHGLGVSYPASSSYVTAVGGTQLNSDSSTDWSATNNGSLGSAAGYMAETTWNDTLALRTILGSGGGVSKIYPMPPWQRSYVQPGAYYRMVPDVSFAASIAFHPYMVCLGDGPCTSGTGGFTPGRDGTGVGGTSLGAPNLAAMLAVVEQANGGRALGNVNPAMYALAAGTSASMVFHDITAGNNFVPCRTGTMDCFSTGSMGYSAGTGYDLATGLGSISAPGLRTALQSLPARTVRLSMRTFLNRADIPPAEVGSSTIVTVDVISNSTAVPTGSVLFTVDGVAQTAAQALYHGQVSGFITLNTLGPHTIDAAYAGDTNFDGAAASITVSAIQATPDVTVDSGGLATLKTPVPLRGYVSAGTVTPTGTLTFAVDGSVASSALPLISGAAGVNYPGFETAGRHTVVATYSGDPLVKAGSSRSTIVNVSAPTQTQNATVSVTATPTTPSVGTPVTMTAAVKSSSASTTAPRGYVTFNVDGVDLPTVPLDATGQANVSYTYTAYGPSNAVATYSGDNLFVSNSGSLYLSVPGPPAPTIALALSTSAVTIPSTGVATVGLNLTSVNGFSGPVSFAGTVTSVSGAGFNGCYVVSPGVLFPSPSGPGTGTFSIALASNSLCARANVVRMGSVASSANPHMHRSAPWYAVVAAGIFGCAILRRRVPRGLLALLVLAFALGATGCSGGGGSSSTPTPTPAPTPTPSPTAGTYTVRITATAQTTGMSSSGTFTLTVQ